jgi:threonine-phosphate decarboxylase
MMNQSFPVHGGQLDLLAKQHNIDPSILLDFSANINPDGPPAIVLQELCNSLQSMSSLIRYPDLHQTALKQALATSLCRQSSEISIANGFVPLLEASLRALQIRRCLLPMPAFNEYQPALMRANIDVVPYPLTSESDFQYDVEGMFSDDCDAILLANPQNPSGALAGLEQMKRLLQIADEKGVYVLLDEAFIDYVPQHTVTPFMRPFPKVILFRSVTKFYAIPGMRIAYCTAITSIISHIDANLPPWPVSNLASIAVQAALTDETYAAATRRSNRERSARLSDGLSALNLQPHPGTANFLLFRLPAHIEPLKFWRSLLVNQRVVLRSCENYPHLPSGYLRTAVRNDADNARLLEALSLELHVLV